MKKFLKIFLCLFLILGVIALIVCYIVIPTETQLAFDKVIEYLNTPIFICGISITLGGVLGFFITRYILANTSVGKKRLNELKEYVDKHIDKQQEENVLSYNNMVDIKEKTDKSINNLSENIEKLEQALSLVPNKKVQEVLNNGKEKEND